jgi:LysM repeat protein
MIREIKLKQCIWFLTLGLAWLSLPYVTFAQSESPNDLVQAINSLRASQGLAPYQIDPWLMAYAQEHAEYQASIQSGTHIHRDGSLPQDIGLVENVANGSAGVVTAAIVVNEIWSDWGHRNTLIGYASGQIGAGIALGDNGLLYYSVDVRPGGQAVGAATQPLGTAQLATATFVPLLTSTPSDNGAIIHTVSEGQSLWGIAVSYGVTVDDIRRLNAMQADATFLRVGQQLLIRPAGAVPTDLPDETSTALAHSNAVASALAEQVETPTETAIPSSTAPPFPFSPDEPTDNPADVLLKNTPLGLALLLIAILGVFLLLLIVSRRSTSE